MMGVTGAEMVLLESMAKLLAFGEYKQCVDVVSGNNGPESCSTLRVVSSIRGEIPRLFGLGIKHCDAQTRA